MYYALTVNPSSIITGVHESMTPITATTFEANPELAGNNVVSIPAIVAFRTGDHILCYNEDGTRKPDLWCIENGYMHMPPGKEIIDGELVDKELPPEEQPITLMDYLSRMLEEAKKESRDLVDVARQESSGMIRVVKLEASTMMELAAQETRNSFQALKPLVNNLMIGKPAEIVLPLIPMMDEWHESLWLAGRSLIYKDYPYRVVQTHDSTENPAWTPEAAPALFAPWHGMSAGTALPWKQPTGAQDMYKAGEWMQFTDGVLYQCLIETAYSPVEYAQAWQALLE